MATVAARRAMKKRLKLTKAATEELRRHGWLIAALSYMAVSNALKRLRKRGLVALERPWHYEHGEAHGATWQVVMSKKCTKVTGVMAYSCLAEYGQCSSKWNI